MPCRIDDRNILQVTCFWTITRTARTVCAQKWSAPSERLQRLVPRLIVTGARTVCAIPGTGQVVIERFSSTARLPRPLTHHPGHGHQVMRVHMVIVGRNWGSIESTAELLMAPRSPIRSATCRASVADHRPDYLFLEGVTSVPHVRSHSCGGLQPIIRTRGRFGSGGVRRSVIRIS